MAKWEDLTGLIELPGLPDITKLSDKELAEVGPRFFKILLPRITTLAQFVLRPFAPLTEPLLLPFRPFIKLFLDTFWVSFFRAYFRPAKPRLQKSKAVLQKETDRIIDIVGFIIPRRHREGLLGDIIEDIALMRAKDYSEKAIRRYAAWQFFVAFVERLKKWIGLGLLYGVFDWVRGHFGKYLGN